MQHDNKLEDSILVNYNSLKRSTHSVQKTIKILSEFMVKKYQNNSKDNIEFQRIY